MPADLALEKAREPSRWLENILRMRGNARFAYDCAEPDSRWAALGIDRYHDNLAAKLTDMDCH